MPTAVECQLIRIVRRNLKQVARKKVPVVTGFIASDVEGLHTTLGRNGSDFSASIVAALLGAESISIWTDVDGVMSADPRIVPQAFSLESLTYDELMELSHFGAKVVYPPSVHPVRAGIVGGEREQPIPVKQAVEMLEIIQCSQSCSVNILASVIPPVRRQTEAGAGGGNELPRAEGSGPGQGATELGYEFLGVVGGGLHGPLPVGMFGR